MWEYVTKHYEELVKEGFDFSLQLDLVKLIADSSYAECLYPTLSHNILCLSGEADFEESLESPIITVQYLRNEEFKVTYASKPKQTNNYLQKKSHWSEVLSYLESLFLRLKLESESVKREHTI